MAAGGKSNSLTTSKSIFRRHAVLVQDIAHGVDGNAAHDHFVVQVRPGAAACVAHIAHQVATAHGVAFAHRAALHVRVAGNQAVAVIDDNSVAVGAVGVTEVGAEPVKIATTSSGEGRRGEEPDVPYRAFSSCESAAGNTLVESMVIEATGLNPVAATGVVETSQLSVMASGVSLIVSNAFSEGEAIAPHTRWSL